MSQLLHRIFGKRNQMKPLKLDEPFSGDNVETPIHIEDCFEEVTVIMSKEQSAKLIHKCRRPKENF